MTSDDLLCLPFCCLLAAVKCVARELVWCCLGGSGAANLGFFALGVRDLGGWWEEGEGRLVSQRTRCGCVEHGTLVLWT